MTDKDIVPGLHELHHTLWHAADHEILAIELHRCIVQCRRQRRIGIEALFYLRD